MGIDHFLKVLQILAEVWVEQRRDIFDVIILRYFDVARDLTLKIALVNLREELLEISHFRGDGGTDAGFVDDVLIICWKAVDHH